MRRFDRICDDGRKERDCRDDDVGLLPGDGHEVDPGLRAPRHVHRDLYHTPQSGEVELVQKATHLLGLGDVQRQAGEAGLHPMVVVLAHAESVKETAKSEAKDLDAEEQHEQQNRGPDDTEPVALLVVNNRMIVDIHAKADERTCAQGEKGADRVSSQAVDVRHWLPVAAAGRRAGDRVMQNDG